MKNPALACISLCAALATAQPPNPAPSKFEINQFDILRFNPASPQNIRANPRKFVAKNPYLGALCGK